MLAGTMHHAEHIVSKTDNALLKLNNIPVSGVNSFLAITAD